MKLLSPMQIADCKMENAQFKNRRGSPAARSLILTFAICILQFAFSSSPAQAQTPPLVVNLATATLRWDYTQGSSPATEFRVKCGPATNNYTRTTAVADVTTRTVSIRAVIGGSGVWFCRAFAANKFGESAGSNEVNFDGGDSPSNGPSGLTVQP